MKNLKTIIKNALVSKDANRMVSLKDRLKNATQSATIQQPETTLLRDTISQ